MNAQVISFADNTSFDLHAEPWPSKYDLFGVQVSSTDYAGVVNVLINAGKRRLPALVDFTGLGSRWMVPGTRCSIQAQFL